MAKRANGEGSIYKRKDGRWSCTVSLGYDELTGKRKRKDLYGKTQKEVLEKLHKLQKEINDGSYVKTNKLTVGAWLDIWLAQYCRHLKPSSFRSYKTHIEYHFKPTIGDMPLQKLKPHNVQMFINGLESSPKTIKNIIGTLNSSLDKAKELSYIKNNPCEYITLPRSEKPEIRVFTDEEVRTLFKALKETPYYNFYKMALFTGLRRAEVLGLTWDCVEWQRGTLRVYRQLQYINSSHMFITPKNYKSRNVALPKGIIDLLKNIKSEQEENKAKYGKAYNTEEDFIFCNELGTHLSYDYVGVIFRKTIKTLDIPYGRLHDLRHTYAVNALRAGDNVKNVQENLGHATPAFTLERYASITSDMLEESRRNNQTVIDRLGI
jgi:phage integrase